jgi:hypothetical protein
VHEMDEEDEEDPCTEEIDQEDDSATVTTFAERRQPSAAPESFVSAPSSPKQLPQLREETELRGPRERRAPAKFDPGSYVAAQHEAQSQFHVAYKANTTMWSESVVYTEPQSYQEAINHPLHEEWQAAIEEEYSLIHPRGRTLSAANGSLRLNTTQKGISSDSRPPWSLGDSLKPTELTISRHTHLSPS